MTGKRPAKPKFKTYLIGYFHIDIAEVRTEEASYNPSRDRPHLQVRLRPALRIGRSTNAVMFLDAIIEAVPYDLHTILTDNSNLLADLIKKRSIWTASARQSTRPNCCDHGI